MVRSDDLLRMLEPPVRPGNLAPPRQPQLPLEQRDFESLLEEARRLGLQVAQVLAMAAASDPSAVSQKSGDPQSSAAASAGTRPLDPLAALDRIENPAVRQLVIARALSNPMQETQAG